MAPGCVSTGAAAVAAVLLVLACAPLAVDAAAAGDRQAVHGARTPPPRLDHIAIDMPPLVYARPVVAQYTIPMHGMLMRVYMAGRRRVGRRARAAQGERHGHGSGRPSPQQRGVCYGARRGSPL